VTLDEIDTTLDRIAATSSFSAADLRANIDRKPADVNLELSRIFQRLQKLIIRMLPKTHSSRQIPGTSAMQCFHFLLPDLLDFQKPIQATVKLLDGFMLKRRQYSVARDVEGLLRHYTVKQLRPQVEVRLHSLNMTKPGVLDDMVYIKETHDQCRQRLRLVVRC
jgi:hypothetical protein